MSHNQSPASQEAKNSVRAAKNLNRWGTRATALFVIKRNIDDMFILALHNEKRK